MVKTFSFLGLILAIFLFYNPAKAVEETTNEKRSSVTVATKATTDSDELKVIETDSSVEINLPAQKATSNPANSTETPSSNFDPLRYTLGPDDVVEIVVLRHPEFSGIFPINLEGKIQYKFVGDIEVTGLTKKELEQKTKEIISTYVINPEVNITITEYKSKVIYVLGEVGQPGKYYMRSEAIPVREAVVQAGLPTQSAAMRRCMLITPDKSGNAKNKPVDIYDILYVGNLKKNIDMRPGDVLYVPSTVIAKIIRVINPVTSTIGVTSGAPEGISTAKGAITSLSK